LQFVAKALAQVGDKYVYGAEVDLDDPDPDVFDCSELVQWACHQTGVYIPDGSTSQFNYCSAKGTRISVDAARSIRGALLFHPGHVAISLGDGRTVEAANPRVGVIIGTIGSRFTSAARVPGMTYDGYGGEDIPGHPPPPP
jgi:cell wall-associated NlpC family hydrolase